MRKTILSILFCVFAAAGISAQTTEFTYQGSLKNSGTAANGNFDFEFKLFDLVSGGTQQGSTIQRLNVAVAGGIFTVSLDFGAGTLPGADRFLDIAVRTAGGGAFTPLAPRQKVVSAPYSVKSLSSTTAITATNATQLGGVAASQYVVTTDPRMTDARSPTAGSTNYVQNGTSPQASSNFNISGTGTANILNAATQFNIGGSRVVSTAGTSNLFVGVGSGQNNTGQANAFVGAGAGQANTSGVTNSFFGTSAGGANTAGSGNSFFGTSSGAANQTGSNNAFFGVASGTASTATFNSFFGSGAGQFNTSGGSNSFFGANAGNANTTGASNTAIGTNANFGSNNLQHATAIGADSTVSTSNTIAVGRSNGADGVVVLGNVGIGTTDLTGAKLRVFGSGALDGIVSQSSDAVAVRGISVTGGGIAGNSGSGSAVAGSSFSGTGVQGSSSNGTGVYGISTSGLAGDFAGRVNISGQVQIGTTSGGSSKLIVQNGGADAIFGLSTSGNGVTGASDSGYGVRASSLSGTAVFGTSDGGLSAVVGLSNGPFGVSGVRGEGAGQAWGVYGQSVDGVGVYGSGGYFAGQFAGRVNITGKLGVGTDVPSAKVEVVGGSDTGVQATSSAVGPTVAAIRGVNLASNGNGIIGEAGGGNGTGVYGVSTSATGYGMVGRNLSGGYAGYFDGTLLAGSFLDVNQFPGGGSTSVCRNGGRLSTCSSSLRYKTNILRYDQGLSLLNKLQPITFDWKSNGMHDVGFGAEDVEKAEPLLVTYNDKGQVEGVKYDRLSVAFVNAFKEQQAQIEKQQTVIESQQKKNDELQKQVEALRVVVCSIKADAEICKKQEK